MDERTLRVLEFDKVLLRLADHCTSSLGKELAEQLRPTADMRTVREWQQETSEAVNLLEAAGSVPLGGLHDIRAALERARLGATLGTEQLLAVADTLRATRRLRAYLLDHKEQAVAPYNSAQPREPVESLLADRALGMSVFPGVEKEIERCIGPEGEVLDAASPELARIRQQMRVMQGRVREKLEAVLRSASAQKIVQDNVITLRNGRYVIPVKQEYRSSLPGIVHDQSGSGATLFIEPLAVVELNNELRQLEAAESEEVERILRQLSELVGESAGPMLHTVRIAAEMDFIFGRARLSLEWCCTEPELNSCGWVSIRSGRHPLLTGKVVPLDIWLGKDFRALVITGPNTGGKTVTLKTVGLFSLMAQAGLHVPAATGSELSVFDAIFADIGDEQSIEQSLSTFSSHLTNIVRILQCAGPQSLVLLDELGAGTDPTEGAALAMSILEHLLAVGCCTVATTHYSELKAFAYMEPGAQNASVEFDVETLRPTYRLSIGVAGSSNAFAIARRLGLPESIIERATARLTQEEIKVDELIRSVEENRRQTARDREEAARLRAEMERLRNQYDEALAQFQARKNEMLTAARREAEQLLAETRKEIEQMIGELRKSRQHDLEETARVARELVEQRQAELRALEPQPVRTVRKARASGPIRRGDTVHIVSLGQEGEVISEPDSNGNVLVQAGALRLSLALKELEKVAGPHQTQNRASSFASLARTKSSTISTELDLRGLTVDEALARVDKYLDDCMLSGLPRARIIHGKGTGALRQAVREHLRGLPQVSAFRYGQAGEGGDGVTVVEF